MRRCLVLVGLSLVLLTGCEEKPADQAASRKAERERSPPTASEDPKVFLARAEKLVRRWILGDYPNDIYNDGKLTRPPPLNVKGALADLNGDGVAEALVYTQGRYVCGTSGCMLYILTPRGRAIGTVSETPAIWPPIRLLSKTSHGWRSLGVQVHGGGVMIPYEGEIAFDGREYVSQAFDTPKVTPPADGTVLIDSLVWPEEDRP